MTCNRSSRARSAREAYARWQWASAALLVAAPLRVGGGPFGARAGVGRFAGIRLFVSLCFPCGAPTPRFRSVLPHEGILSVCPHFSCANTWRTVVLEIPGNRRLLARRAERYIDVVAVEGLGRAGILFDTLLLDGWYNQEITDPAES